MKIAFFSDIHGNLPALEIAIKESGNVDGYIILGDVVTVSLLTSDPNDVGYHYHLYLDNSMIGMFYDNYFDLENISWGEHTLMVTLADSSHIECADASCSQTVSFTLQEPSPETVELSITDVDPVLRSFQINTNNSIAFSSFEFDIEGVNPISISGGGFDEFDFVSNIINNSHYNRDVHI